MSDIIPPAVLYHYTTAEGILGILNEKALWATKIHYLNDATELVEPFRIAKEILESLLVKVRDGSIRNIKEDSIYRNLSDLSQWGHTNICVISFCAKADLLSQWRAYGISSSAYSIGFDASKLIKTIQNAPCPFQLKQCKYYDRDEYYKAIDQFILESINKEDLHDFKDRFIEMAATMKLKFFSEEEEWRLVSHSPIAFYHFEFRAGKSMLIPYYPLPIDLSSIAEIIIGPCQHPDLAERAIWGLSHKFELADVLHGKIKVSEIPYRNY